MDQVVTIVTGHLGVFWWSAQQWWSSAPLAELREPLAAIMLCLALLAGIVGRDLFILLGAAIWAALGVHLASLQAPEVQPFVVAATIAAQMLIVIGSYRHHRTKRRDRSTVRALEVQKRNLQEKLDQEILWRMAGREPADAPHEEGNVAA